MATQVFVGKKSPFFYAFLISASTDKEFLIQARGRFIAKAVDVANIARRMDSSLSIKDVQIGSEMLETEQGERRVSIIRILLTRS
ncbi:MAG: RNA-binding protein [Chloroflexi bacterium]|nr:MAG: RNA-binding protein [Chloroflexota bacterium]